MAKEIVSLEGAFAYHINRAYRMLRVDFLAMTRNAGFEITPEQYFILNKLYHNPGQSQTELAAELNDRPNITRGLEILEKKKLIQRARDKLDARKFSVRLTTQGEDVLRLLNSAIEKRRKIVYHGLDDRDLKSLRRILSQIESNLLEQ